MVFSSIEFIFVFLPCFFLAYFIVPKRVWRNLVLLAASLFFYAWGEPLYVFAMLASIGINYLFALAIHYFPRRKKPWLAAAVLFNVLFLGVFKYTDFVIGSLNGILRLNLPLSEIALPIGISFYTFQVLSYVIDVYRGTVEVQKNPLYLAAYVSAFPQLVAGPIVRYADVAEDLTKRRETVSGFADGGRRFIIGLAKKVLIANNMAYVADSILKFPAAEFGAAGAWVALFAYTLQIYFDFSGYSDMAIGLGKMMGFRFPENFQYPYIAKSASDFWRRWHLSLSTFFRDYVYIPLGGNRVSTPKWIRNMLAVWLLTGLWHGAGWNFILWGLYWGVFLIGERLFWGKYLQKLPSIVQHLYGILLIMLGWALFRIEDFDKLGQFFGALFGASGGGTLGFLVFSHVIQFKHILWAAVGILASTPVLAAFWQKHSKSGLWLTLRDIALIALFALCTVYLLTGSFNPFIYFKF